MTRFYQRKLYALLRNSASDSRAGSEICQYLNFLSSDLEFLNQWWQELGHRANDIGSSSDRVNFSAISTDPTEIRHPVSGERQPLQPKAAVSHEEQVARVQDAFTAINQTIDDPDEACKRIFWWCWRFYPELVAGSTVLYPAHSVLPDNPLYSHNSTVSALTGTLFPQGWQQGDEESQPYLLILTFSPIQEFIKASRKFLDFWSGSYMLHYLSARLCWHVAQKYGPDAVITPSLWGQEIIDALLLKEYPEFAQSFRDNPVSRFESFASRSLSTAGLPNTITVMVSGKDEAIALGQELSETLRQIWGEIAKNVREAIKSRVIEYLEPGKGVEEIWESIKKDFDSLEQPNPYRRELEQFQKSGCWEWNTLWDAQISHTWETYFVAVPFGHPEQDLIHGDTLDQKWIEAQNEIAQPRDELPTVAEQQAYQRLNVGTWWGSLQARLGQGIQVVKNSRNWKSPVSPGERSSLSGQYSAVHPRCNYARFKQGRGMTAGSIRLFWRVMSLAYPGLFDGSERLNALELTKRMAWYRGGVAASLGIELQEDDYELLVRFPNLNSIAAARFAVDCPEKVHEYWSRLRQAIQQDSELHGKHDKFCAITRGRPFQITLADAALQKTLPHYGNGYNGVMFSSKWLSEDMGLAKEGTKIPVLRSLVTQAHQLTGFGDSSPADWWVLVMGDGDGMGQYVSGHSLKFYSEYLVQDLVDRTGIADAAWELLLKTRKRMGPATHVGLNRALLDFSNRLVPHLTEKRFCGRVIYSGGDDVMAVLPLADLPEFLQSLRAAWCGGKDPKEQFYSQGGYWHPKEAMEDLPDRPLFTMGQGATMSCGIVIAHKSVPLPTVLEQIWEAEKERAKKLLGGDGIPPKDGLCFRVIYGSGNTLEAVMKGHLLESWWKFTGAYEDVDLSPVLYRLAEVLPRHVVVNEHDRLCRQAATAILSRRDEALPDDVYHALLDWLDAWENWAWIAQKTAGRGQGTLGATPDDLANLLRFTAFWVARRRQELSWGRQQEVDDE